MIFHRLPKRNSLAVRQQGSARSFPASVRPIMISLGLVPDVTLRFRYSTFDRDFRLALCTLAAKWSVKFELCRLCWTANGWIPQPLALTYFPVQPYLFSDKSARRVAGCSSGIVR